MRFDGEVHGGAEWGPPGDSSSEWRYRLWRSWGTGPRVAFIGLNPSTATETVDDPTVRRCVGFARAWGFAGLEMLNLFGLRSTDPRGLYRHREPYGDGNMDAIRIVTRECEFTVCAWGCHGKHQNQGTVVAGLLRLLGRDLRVLSLTKEGFPGHPLYLRADAKPERWIP